MLQRHPELIFERDMGIRLGILGGRLFRGLHAFLFQPAFRIWLKFLFFKPLKKRYRPTVFRWGKTRFEVPDALSFFWQFHEIMVRGAYDFPSARPNPVIFDCGSNVGLSLYSYRRTYPAARLVAFEPDAQVFKALQANIIRNHIGPVELHEAAVWTKDGMMHFNSEGADGGSLGSGNSEVRTLDLAKLLEKEVRIDFLKMDIEGAESALLPHIREQLHKIRFLFIEYHSYNGKPQDLHRILEILTAEGFSYYLETDVRRRNPFVPRTVEAHVPEFQTNIFATNLRP